MRSLEFILRVNAPRATHHSEGFKQRCEKGVISPDLCFKKMTTSWRMNLKGTKAGAREMRGIHAEAQV